MTRNLLLSGGPGHDFASTTAALVDVFAECGITTTVVGEPAEVVELLTSADGADISVLTVNALRWSMRHPGYEAERDRYGVVVAPSELDALGEFVRSGGGLLAMHTAVICFDGAPQWRELCGASWRWGTSSHPPYGPVTVTATDTGRTHELTRGVDELLVDDEVYGALDEVDDLDPLLVGTHGGRDHPVLWARHVGRGRVVTDLLGHDAASISHPGHRTVLSRAIRWVAGRPVSTHPAGAHNG